MGGRGGVRRQEMEKKEEAKKDLENEEKTWME